MFTSVNEARAAAIPSSSLLTRSRARRRDPEPARDLLTALESLLKTYEQDRALGERAVRAACKAIDYIAPILSRRPSSRSFAIASDSISRISQDIVTLPAVHILAGDIQHPASGTLEVVGFDVEDCPQ
jgi:hypothetical protein